MKFRKKPVVIEAQQLTVDNMNNLEAWCNGQIKGVKLPPEKRVIDIETLEGEMRADIGDWIIRGIKGEFYPCKPDIFEMTYELVGANETPHAHARRDAGGDERNIMKAWQAKCPYCGMIRQKGRPIRCHVQACSKRDKALK